MYRHTALTRLALLTGGLLFVSLAVAQPAPPAGISERSGWVVLSSDRAFTELGRRLEEAVKTNKMGLVTNASASEGAKAQGITIAGNRVVGVFRNDYARRMLSASVPAGIEAPIRFYLTENANGTATLSYKTPTAVFSPYFLGTSDELKKLAMELDGVFRKIAEEAVK